MKPLLFFILFLALTLQAVPLTKHKLPKGEIILPAEPNPIELMAAEELATHIQLVSGARLPVVEVPSGNATPIFLGRAASLDLTGIPKNGGIVCISSDRIDIAGVDGEGAAMDFKVAAGTLYGVYEFLENCLGIRWLWPGEFGTRVIPNDSIDLAPAEWKTEVPMVGWWRTGASENGWNDPANGAKFFQQQTLWLRRHRFHSVDSRGYGHAYTEYWARFGKEHPEYFNLLPDGQRRPDPLYVQGDPSLVGMCVTNKGFIHQVIEDWKTDPSLWINANENDTPGKCVCPECMKADESDDEGRLERAQTAYAKKDGAWYAELGSVTQRYCKFYMELLEEGRKINPDCYVIGDIYTNYSEPPKPGTVLDEHVILRFCPIIMFPWTPAKIRQFKGIWKAWRDSKVTLTMNPAFTLDGANMPLLYYKAFVECFDYARDNGMLATDFDSLTGMFGANGLTNYVIAARQGGGTHKSIKELENDYFSAFGPAEKSVRKCMNYLEKITSSATKNTTDAKGDMLGGDYVGFCTKCDFYYPPKVLQKALEYLEKAARQAKGNPDAEAKVRFVTAGIRSAYLSSCIAKAFRESKETGNQKKLAALLKEQREFRATNEHLLFENYSYSYAMESRLFPLHLAKVGGKGVEIKNWSIRFDPDKVGLEQNWFEDTTSADWKPAVVTSSWETQQAGQDWEKEHGAPFKGVAWYQTKFILNPWQPDIPAKLFFGAVDGDLQIFFNGKLILQHHPFQNDPDSWLKEFEVNLTGLPLVGENTLIIRVEKGPIGESGIWKPVYFIPN